MQSEEKGERELSDNLRKMKFMQRKNERDLREKLARERETKMKESHWVLASVEGLGGGLRVEIDERSEDVGLGRRSFGGFNPDIERLTAGKVLVMSEEKEKEEQISAKEMAARYAEHIGRAPSNHTDISRKRVRENVDDAAMDVPERKKTKNVAKDLVNRRKTVNRL